MDWRLPLSKRPKRPGGVGVARWYMAWLDNPHSADRGESVLLQVIPFGQKDCPLGFAIEHGEDGFLRFACGVGISGMGTSCENFAVYIAAKHFDADVLAIILEETVAKANDIYDSPILCKLVHGGMGQRLGTVYDTVFLPGHTQNSPAPSKHFPPSPRAGPPC